MHNALIHAGGWLPGYVVQQADFVAIDSLLFKSINGDDGGTWAPSSAITIGGLGLTVNTTLTANGLFLVPIGCAMIVGGAATFNYQVNVNDVVNYGASTVTTWQPGAQVTWMTGTTIVAQAGSTFVVGGALTVSGSLGGNTTFSGNKTFTGGFTTTFGAATTIVHSAGSAETYNGGASNTHLSGSTETHDAGSTLNLNGSVNMSGDVFRSGTGYANDRVTDGADANTTYSPHDGDIIFVDVGTLTAPRTYTFTKVGINVGARMRIVNIGSTALTLKDQSGFTIATVRSGATAGQYREWVEISRLGGSADTWYAMGGQLA